MARWELEGLCLVDRAGGHELTRRFSVLLRHHIRNNPGCRSYSREATGYVFYTSGKDTSHIERLLRCPIQLQLTVGIVLQIVCS